MHFHIQILHDGFWHTISHTRHAMNAMRLLGIYSHEGTQSRAVCHVDGKPISIVQTFSPVAN